MTDAEMSKLFNWAKSSSQMLYFGFGISDEGAELLLNRHRKGRAVLHDLVQIEANKDLKAQRYGTVSVDDAEGKVTFTPNRPFALNAQRQLKQRLKRTSVRSLELVFAERSEEQEGEIEA